MILIVLVTIFNWVSYFTNKIRFASTARILYSVAGVINQNKKRYQVFDISFLL